MKHLTRLFLCTILSFSLTELPILGATAQASMIQTSEALDQLDRAQGERDVALFMDRQDVREQLMLLGIGQEEAQRRLAGLSDEEVRQLSADIQNATVGGSVGGILVVVLLVILIIYFAKRI